MPISTATLRNRARRWPAVTFLCTVVSMAAGCALFEIFAPTPPAPSVPELSVPELSVPELSVPEPPTPDRPGVDGVEDVDRIPSLEAKKRAARRPESPPPPLPAATDPGQLVLGQWRQGWLHCEAKKCNDSYRVEVPGKGELRLDLRAPGGEGLPDLGVIIEDRGRQLVGTSIRPFERPRVIRKKIEPGSYQVQVYALGGNGEMVSYDLVAKLVKIRPPKPRPTPKPRPQPRVVTSEILEIERQEGEPTFVLIEAGQSQGLTPGLGGHLVENGKRIAEIEVVEVFPDGSRVKIVDRLLAPITIETTAEIRVPKPR